MWDLRLSGPQMAFWEITPVTSPSRPARWLSVDEAKAVLGELRSRKLIDVTITDSTAELNFLSTFSTIKLKCGSAPPHSTPATY